MLFNFKEIEIMQVKRRPMRRKKINIKYIIISTDFEKVVCKKYNTIKADPFYGVYVESFDYKLEDHYLTFTNEERALNAIKHFHLTTLAESENCKFRTYSFKCN
jgi:hypothetical protein